MFEETIFESIETQITPLRNFAFYFDHVHDIHVVMTKFKESGLPRHTVQKNRAILEFISKIINEEQMKIIKNGIFTTIKTAIFEILEKNNIDTAFITIPEPVSFYANPNIDVRYKNQRVITFNISSTKYTPVVLYIEHWLIKKNETAKRNLFKAERKEDSLMKNKEISKLNKEIETLEEHLNDFKKVEEECLNVLVVLSDFLKSYQYVAE